MPGNLHGAMVHYDNSLWEAPFILSGNSKEADKVTVLDTSVMYALGFLMYVFIRQQTDLNAAQAGGQTNEKWTNNWLRQPLLSVAFASGMSSVLSVCSLTNKKVSWPLCAALQ